MPRLGEPAPARGASGLAVPQDFAIGTLDPSADRVGVGPVSPPDVAPGAARRRIALLVATAGGAGYAPIAPGTAGAAVGVALYGLLAPAGAAVVVGVSLALLVVGVFAADVAERVYGRGDDGRIVIDEVVGQLLALAPLPVLLPASPRAPLWLGAGFLAFRLFDIWKPGPVGWAERRFTGGKGVMFDDVGAGLLAAVCVSVLCVVTGSAAP